ncbi:MAG TPA: hypothetical protein VLL08_29440 [Kineosporiaceae bacterium]|nr:hypothetical protein [Kineosporiaceae bacterium]
MRTVPEHYAFTDNVRDLSNTNGYQFEFVCERCGNGYRSPFVRDKVDLGRTILRSVGDLIGGSGYRLSQAANALDWNRGTNSAAKDRAMDAAVETVREEFRQCRGCGDWVCHNVCWNTEIGQCLTCSPAVAEEISRAQAAAQVRQIQQQAETVDWTSDLDISTRATVTCPGCQAKVAGGKFCSSCGTSLTTVTVSCRSCGFEQNTPGAAFCADCGHSMA